MRTGHSRGHRERGCAGPGDLEEEGSRGVRPCSRPKEREGRQAWGGDGRGMTSSQQSWASGDLRAGGRARVGVGCVRAPQGLLPRSHGAPSGRKGPGQKPRQARGCGHRHAGGRRGGREPWGFGAPSVSPAGAGWGWPRAGWRGSRTHVVTNANTSLGQVNRLTTSGQPCSPRPDLPGALAPPTGPCCLPLRVASRRPCSHSVHPAPGFRGVAQLDWVHGWEPQTPSPPHPPPAPELLWATALAGTPGLSECPNTPPALAVYHLSLLPSGQDHPQPCLRPALRLMASFPAPTHAPVGSLGTGGVGDRPSACPSGR